MKDKKKLLIGILCTLIIFMTIAYAYLAQQLQIVGSTAIGSTWDVRITNIEIKDKSVGANNKQGPSYDATTANFAVGFTSPGDYIVYEIEVSNLGTLDAVIDSINVSKPDSGAIKYTISGIKKGNKLISNNKKIFDIKVEYKTDYSAQPQIISSNLSLTINYIDAYAVENVDDGTEDIIVNQEAYAMGDIISFAGSNWYVINNSSADEDYVTLMKADALTKTELDSLWCGNQGNTVRWSWSNLVDYNSSIAKSCLTTYIYQLNDNNLKEVDGYKIRLITREELNNNLGCVTDDCSVSTNASWIYQNSSDYWIMPTNSKVWALGSDGKAFQTVMYWENERTSYREYQYHSIRPVINLYKSAIE